MSGPLVILGDGLLDIDLEGTADRLAPDAPVPVLRDVVERARPGGAALAAAMAAAEHARAALHGRCRIRKVRVNGARQSRPAAHSRRAISVASKVSSTVLPSGIDQSRPRK